MPRRLLAGWITPLTSGLSCVGQGGDWHPVSVSFEIAQVSKTAFVWQHYEPAVKSELFSTALLLATETYLVDPIPLAPAAFHHLLRGRSVSGVIVTNVNHPRDSLRCAKSHSAPIFAHREIAGSGELVGAKGLSTSEMIGLEVVEIPGGPSGEIALHHGEEGGELIVGDSLIHFDPYGFTFLPDKYCTDSRRMRRALRALLDLHFERILFAHGTPIISRGRERLEQLLASAA